MLPDRNRRRIVKTGLLLPLSNAAAATGDLIRFGTTPVFLDDQISLLASWQSYLEGALQRPVRFVQRGSYREIVDGLMNSSIDVAWLCGYPYVLYESRLALVAVPLYQSVPLYRSHLIVPRRDMNTGHISQLEGKVFAYSDPLSNSGHLVPRVELIRVDIAPEAFFRRTFFTFSHRKVVDAVRAGVANAGSVDGYIWETLELQQPKVTEGVRVAWRSPQYGFPPLVGRASLGVESLLSLTRAFEQMQSDETGRQILARLNVDGFVAAKSQLFNGVRELVKVAGRVPA